MDKVISQLEIPRRLRAFVRARESSLIVLAALVGAIAGLVVAAMSNSVDLLHTIFFQLEPGVRLSGLHKLPPVLAISVPLVGGLVFGVARELLARWRPDREIDPIEANALHGGRMSLTGSVIVAAQTVWSSGVGASVGIEAGYTQFASGIASRIGMAFRLRRADLRILVGCGAAGGIAGAFGAPLAGAFYAFELIIGGYSPNSLAPVAVSALLGYLIAHALSPAEVGIVAPDQMTVAVRDLIVSGMIGVLCAAAGILIMRGVALCDALFSRLSVPLLLRTTIGGLAVGLLAAVAPQVMSSGHGALHFAGILNLSLWTVALLFVLKIAASIISLGSGFRGGLFFSSLLVGALGGQLLAVALTTIWPNASFDANAYAVISMSALSAAVIGGPLTMTFIALETTGDLWLTTAVLIAVIIASQVTREMFGYSFATWRFHLRGETIRSAADIGWMRELTVGKMMRHDAQTVSAAMLVASFREAFPLGSSAAVVAVDDHRRYVGMVLLADAHAAEVSPDQPIKALVRATEVILMPNMAIKEAVLAFDQAETEALAVVDSRTDRRVIGVLTEAYALRRYAAELERRRKELIGED
ncbi:MAG: chloride channel protein [Hyphomicrobiales bacterium]|nr:chloride channel protein [Hyphomicrobiales bacterium]MDE2283535.1 chloride channel protein [Hyphomicrobiales bacterium]MDE2372635.1 chloride channel protein [Hyphomicrobiales bacterium]